MGGWDRPREHIALRATERSEMTFYSAEPAAKGICSDSSVPCERSIDLLVCPDGRHLLEADGGPLTGNLLHVSCPIELIGPSTVNTAMFE